MLRGIWLGAIEISIFFLILNLTSVSGEPISLNSCQNIYLPGEYALQTDIIDINSTCFTILSHNVYFNGNGHILSANYSIPANGINIDKRNNITLSNFTFSGFQSSVLIGSSSNSLISNSNFYNNSYGIELKSSNRVNISNNSFLNNTNVGIYSHVGSNYNLFSENDFFANNYGIRIENGLGSLITGSIFNGNFLAGAVFIDVASSGLYNNTFVSNGQGIRLEKGFNNSLSNNSFYLNLTSPLDYSSR